MPKVSFYLRNEDVAKWKAIEKKTQWAHDKLAEGVDGVVKVKAEPGTMMPGTDIEVEEFHFTSPKVQKIVETLYEPTDDWGA